MTYNTGEPDPSDRRWPSLLTFPVLLLIGWVLYELTAQPALGVAAVCVKFGWDDFRTAWWLRGSDPSRPRGRAFFSLFIASGLWKMAITASLMIFGYIALHLAGLAGGKQLAPHIVGTVLTAFFGIALAAGCVALAIFQAWRCDVRLWLHPAMHAARRKNRWPPQLPAHTANGAGLLCGTTWFALAVPLLLVGLALLVQQFQGQIQRGTPGAAVLVVGFPLLCGLTALGLFFFVRHVLNGRIFAATAAECWKDTCPPPAAAIAVLVPPPASCYVGDEIAASRGRSETAALEERVARPD
ncbi:hypothetical protein AYO44_02470 [Planctomycetaceae bacterium SCGC AG-212-F19]|nr:hypothetical protein AYO44_02470 [Planctomycetaceae bacterium SCGC AG-212-F19]